MFRGCGIVSIRLVLFCRISIALKDTELERGNEILLQEINKTFEFPYSVHLLLLHVVDRPSALFSFSLFFALASHLLLSLLLSFLLTSYNDQN
jgi:hypothetical protein